MNKLVSRRNRVLRVRHVQHQQALAETVAARDAQRSLENNAERIRTIRGELFDGEGVVDGASLAARRELASRLDQAGRQLEGAIYDARRKVDQKEGLRLIANREREIADKLKARAIRAREEYRERQIQKLPRSQPSATKGGEDA
ncbi:MAG: hypothetical protein U5M50_01410 [Sphingobium sp.]|nr:hypothetical protein [Sphingobium sp.]